MEVSYKIEVSNRAEQELAEHVDYVLEAYGSTYAIRLDRKLVKAIDGLERMPKRFTRVKRLIGREFEYRRVLVGRAHRIIFTIDERRRRVNVVRVDLQRGDPASLDDLP